MHLHALVILTFWQLERLIYEVLGFFRGASFNICPAVVVVVVINLSYKKNKLDSIVAVVVVGGYNNNGGSSASGQ